MAIERVNSVYDLPAIIAEHEKYLAVLKESKAAIIDLNSTRIGAKSSSLSELTKATQDLDKAIGKTNTTTELGIKENARLQESIKAVNSVINARFASEAKLATVTTDYNKQTIANRTETSRLNQEIKNGVQAEQAALGSRDRARAQIKVLTAEKDKLNLVNKDEAAQYDLIVTKLQKYENFLKSTGSAAEKQRANIGNYPQVGNFSEAFGVLSKELDDVRGKLKTTLDPASLKKFEQEERLLAQLTENLGKAFKSPTQELRAFTTAAKEIGQQFGIGSKAFTEFAAEVGSKKDELADIQSTINFSASDTKYLDGIVSAISGVAGAYGVAQSATQLFGDDNEDLQKQMVKLQAVLTLVTSLQSVLNAIQTESGAVQVSLAAKTGLLNAARTIQAALTTTSATAEQAASIATAEQAISAQAATVAIGEEAAAAGTGAVANTALAGTAEAATVAMGAETVATEAASVATTEFATVLIASGIGAIIVAIAAGAVYLVSKIKEWTASTHLNSTQQKELNDTLVVQYDTLKKLSDLIVTNYQSESDALKQQQSLLESAGQNQYKLFAIKEKIAALNKKEADEAQKLAIANAEKNYPELKGLAAVSQARADNIADYQDYVKSTVSLTEALAREQSTVGKDRNEDLIGDLKKEIDTRNGVADNLKKSYDIQTDIVTKATQAQSDADNLATQKAKFNADEIRKIQLESVRIEADAVTSKNALVLSNERSTLDQRLAAIKSNAAQQKAIVNAELRDVQNDPSKKGTADETIAIEKASAERIKITNETNRAVFDATEVDRKRRLAAELDLNKTLLNADKALQDEVIANQFGALDAKVKAAEKAADDQEAILRDEYNHTRATTILSNEELLALDASYNQSLVALDKTTAIQLRELQEKATADFIAQLNARQKAQTDAATDRVDIGTNNTATNVINDGGVAIAAANGQKRVNLEAKLQHDLNQIDKEGELERLKIQGDELDQQLGAALLIEAPTKDIEARITENKRKEAELRKGITDDEYNYEKAKRDKRLSDVEQGEEAVLDVVQAFEDASIDREKNRLAEQQQAVDEKAKSDIDAVNASTRTEQEKADAITIIQAKAAAEKKILDDKQKEQDYKKAQFDKAIAILKISAQIALDIATFNYVAAALAGAALIKLIATPIPKYRGGRGTGKDEMALVHEGEFIDRGNGLIEATPSVESLTHLMPHHKVYKDKATMMKELAMSNMPLSNYRVTGDGSISKSDMKQMTNEIVGAVSDISFHHTTVTKAGWRTQNERLAKYDAWKNKL